MGETEMLARFSTVAGEQGAADAERDPERAGGQVPEGFRPGMLSATAEETKRLLRAYGLSRDRDIRDQLVDSYMPLVKNLCRRFQSAREPQEDLIQVGVIGLLNAIEKFDPERGTSFSSLAIPEILGAILNFLRDHGSLLKVPGP